MRGLTIGFMGALLAILFIIFFALMTGRAEGIVTSPGEGTAVAAQPVDIHCPSGGDKEEKPCPTPTPTPTPCANNEERQWEDGSCRLIYPPEPECWGMSDRVPYSPLCPRPSATPTPTATPIVSVTTTPTPRSTPTSTSGQAGVMTPTSTPIKLGSTPITEMPSALPSTGGEGSDGGGIDWRLAIISAMFGFGIASIFWGIVDEIKKR